MQVEISNRQKAVRCPAREVRRVLELGLRMEGRDAELSVALVGDEEMTALNERFLGKARTTDVLAFPYSAEGEPLAGEVIVNADWPRARRPAASTGRRTN